MTTTTQTQTNPAVNAYYMGRNSVWHERKIAAQSDFASAAEWKSYLDGRRDAQAENRLDADTEWDHDNERGE